MKEKNLLVFEVGCNKFSFDANITERIMPAARLSCYPDMPALVEGLLNYGGKIIPVLNIRCITGTDRRPLKPQDYFIMFKAKGVLAVIISESIPYVSNHTQSDESVFDQINIRPEIVEDAAVINNEIVIQLCADALMSEEMLYFINNIEEPAA